MCTNENNTNYTTPNTWPACTKGFISNDSCRERMIWLYFCSTKLVFIFSNTLDFSPLKQAKLVERSVRFSMKKLQMMKEFFAMHFLENLFAGFCSCCIHYYFKGRSVASIQNNRPSRSNLMAPAGMATNCFSID